MVVASTWTAGWTFPRCAIIHVDHLVNLLDNSAVCAAVHLDSKVNSSETIGYRGKSCSAARSAKRGYAMPVTSERCTLLHCNIRCNIRRRFVSPAMCHFVSLARLLTQTRCAPLSRDILTGDPIGFRAVRDA